MMVVIAVGRVAVLAHHQFCLLLDVDRELCKIILSRGIEIVEKKSVLKRLKDNF